MLDTLFADDVKAADVIAVWCADVGAYQYVPPGLFRYNKVPNEWSLTKNHPVSVGDFVLWIGERGVPVD